MCGKSRRRGEGSAAAYDGEFGPETLALDDSWSRQRRCVGAIAAPHTAYHASPKREKHWLGYRREFYTTECSRVRQGKEVQPKEPLGLRPHSPHSRLEETVECRQQCERLMRPPVAPRMLECVPVTLFITRHGRISTRNGIWCADMIASTNFY